MNSEVRRVINMLREEGWEEDEPTGENHPRMRWPETGQRIVLPSSPSDYRSLRNAVAQARRISGCRPDSHKSPSFKGPSRGSGFDLDAAKRGAESRRHHAARLAAELDNLENRIINLNPRRDRAELLRLASEHTSLSRRLKANGGT